MIAVPTVDLTRKVVKIGNCSGAKLDKFAKFKFTPTPAAEVGTPAHSPLKAANLISGI